jgi:hypothetical protein
LTVRDYYNMFNNNITGMTHLTTRITSCLQRTRIIDYRIRHSHGYFGPH